MKKISIVLTFCSLFMMSGFAQKQDHPMIKRYPNATIGFHYQKAYNELQMPTAVVDSEPGELIDVKGHHTSILYFGPEDHSTIQIFRHYERVIKEAGGEILFSCTGKYAPDGCDDYSKHYGLKFFSANYRKRRNNTDQYIYMERGSDDQAFLVAKFEDSKTTYLEIGITGKFIGTHSSIQLEIVEEKNDFDVKGKIGLLAALKPDGIEVYVCNSPEDAAVPFKATKDYYIATTSKNRALSFSPIHARRLVVATEDALVFYDPIARRETKKIPYFGSEFKSAFQQASEADLSIIKNAKRGGDNYFLVTDVDWINKHELLLDVNWAHDGNRSFHALLVYNMTKKSITWYQQYEGFDRPNIDKTKVQIDKGKKIYELSFKENQLYIEQKQMEKIEQNVGISLGDSKKSLNKVDFFSLK